ncbi:MAG: response regulator [Paracraurococcus sp.]
MLFTAPLRVALGFALAVAFGWLFLSLWRRDRTQPALAFWAAAHGSWAVAALLFGADALQAGPLGLGAANMMNALGYGLIWGGARRFGGHPGGPFGIAAGAGAMLVLLLMPGFIEAVPARVLASGLIILTYDLAIALTFRAGMARQRLPSHPTVIGLLLAHGLVFGLRALGAGLELLGADLAPLLPPATTISVLLILSLVLTAAMTVALVALAREQAELASNAVLVAARDAAAAASAEKSRFLARMSHELRTPLNGVLGLAEALARDPALPPPQREQAATLERAGRHLLAIVNDALDLARVEAGRLQWAPAPVRLRPLLEEALELIQPAAAAKRIGLRLDPVAPLPEAVLADAVRLRQILLNLLGNAVKFTPAGGSVVLRVDQPEFGRMRLAVSDSGPGIPAALRPKLFGEFVQGEGQDAAGAGLGLAISAALARGMGGTLDHAPGPDGCGSVFTALLPLPVAEPPALPVLVPAPAAEAPAPRPLRLLVVDDARVNRQVVRALLRPEGHEVVEAEDGPAALAALQGGPLPDAVLMDVNMPGMDGFQVTEAIRALDGPAARVPVIALTGDAMPEAVEAGRAAGMDGHLTKPLQRAVLLAELARVLPGR